MPAPRSRTARDPRADARDSMLRWCPGRRRALFREAQGRGPHAPPVAGHPAQKRITRSCSSVTFGYSAFKRVSGASMLRSRIAATAATARSALSVQGLDLSPGGGLGGGCAADVDLAIVAEQVAGDQRARRP